MTRSDLLNELKEVLQRDEALAEDMQLDDIEEWDSLAVVSVINLYDTLFGILITGKQLRSCKQVSDLLSLVESSLEN